MKMRFAIPLGLFASLVILFAMSLGVRPRELPSPLIGKPVPQFRLPQVRTPEASLASDDLPKTRATLFNVWASWCAGCREEHPFLVELAKRGDILIYGLNYKDERSDALVWLQNHGDPYRASAYDRDGRVGMDWGVYGVPETFLIDGTGTVRYKHVGPLTPQVWHEKIEPLVKKLQQGKI